MSNKQLLLWMMVPVLVVTSCKSKKGLVANTNPQTDKAAKTDIKSSTLNQTVLNQNTFNYYSANGDFEFTEGKTNQELGISIVMEKDQYVMMHVTAVMGISVARILATPDSLVILDMLHRKAIIANYQYLKKYTGVELRLQQLQNLFAGNTMFAYNNQTMRVDTVNGHLHMSQQLVEDLIQSTQYNELFKVLQTSMYQAKKQQQLDIDYREFYTESNNRFPSDIRINVQTEKKMEAQFRLKNFVFEKKKDLQFSIPKSYEVVRL